MAAVNCYLPDELRDRFRERFGAERSFSEVLRQGVIDALAQAPELEPTEQAQR